MLCAAAIAHTIGPAGVAVDWRYRLIGFTRSDDGRTRKRRDGDATKPNGGLRAQS